MTDKKTKRLGDYLIEEGLVDEGQLSAALDTQSATNQPLGEILIEQGVISQTQLIRILAIQYNIPFVDIEKEPIDENVLKIISPEKLKKWKVFPLSIKDGVLVVAVTNPLDVTLFQELRYLTGKKINPVAAAPESIEKLLSLHFGAIYDIEEAICEDEHGEENKEISALHGDDDDEAPVVKLVQTIMSDGIKMRASDIHIEPQKKDVRVRYRIDGVLKESLRVPKKLQNTLVSRIKIISSMDIAESRRPQDGRMQVSLDKKNYDIRVSSLPDAFGEKIVLRILAKEEMNIDLAAIGVERKDDETLKRLVHMPYGIILITGPTGSGKSTSLYCMLKEVNDESQNIVTLEDPIEYEIDGINQTAVNKLAGYTFANGMRHILRQDPDIIMVGEIRDIETAEIAVQAALTGHLVLSTLHTNNASSSVIRLIDMKVEPFLISSSVLAIIAQRLVRKLCPYCAQKADVPEDLREIIEKQFKDLSVCNFKKPAGCEKCGGIGYSGRTGIFEILNMTPEIKECIMKNPDEHEIERLALLQGMRTLQQSALEKAASGQTSLDEVVRVTFVKRI